MIRICVDYYVCRRGGGAGVGSSSSSNVDNTTTTTTTTATKMTKIVVNHVDPSSDTIKVIKFKIGIAAKEKGIEIDPPIEQQRLVFGDKILDEKGHLTLSDLDIIPRGGGGGGANKKDDDLVFLLEHRFLVVKMRGGGPRNGTLLAQFHVIDPTVETLDSMKTKILVEAKKQSIALGSPEAQCIFHDNQKLLLLNSAQRQKKLSEYNIEKDSTLEFFAGLHPIFVKTLKGETLLFLVELCETIGRIKKKIKKHEGVPTKQQRLFYAGHQLAEEDRTLHSYNIRPGSTLQLVLKLSGDITTFTFSDTSDPLIYYLMLTDHDRKSAPVPMEALCAKAKSEGANPSHSFVYQQDCDILDALQRDVLCRFLDFVWNEITTAIIHDDPDGGGAKENNKKHDHHHHHHRVVDLRLVIRDEHVLALLAAACLDISTSSGMMNAKNNNSNNSTSAAAAEVLERLHNVHVKDLPSKIMLRMTCGPTNTCIDFHCDKGDNTFATTQVPLNSTNEYQGGNLVFFVNQQLHVIPRPPGSLVQHQSRALHGVTSVTWGTRKSLFVVDDKRNSLAEEDGIVEITSHHVDAFLMETAAGKN